MRVQNDMIPAFFIFAFTETYRILHRIKLIFLFCVSFLVFAIRFQEQTRGCVGGSSRQYVLSTYTQLKTSLRVVISMSCGLGVRSARHNPAWGVPKKYAKRAHFGAAKAAPSEGDMAFQAVSAALHRRGAVLLQAEIDKHREAAAAANTALSSADVFMQQSRQAPADASTTLPLGDAGVRVVRGKQAQGKTTNGPEAEPPLPERRPSTDIAHAKATK
jgi:hypothetical protein